MKKSLSLLVAIAMVFSMFATVASAATTAADAGKYLQELKVIAGDQNGDLMEDSTWKRQDLAVLISRLMGKEEEAKATAKSHTYTDVRGTYYDGFLSWAKAEGLMQGHSDMKFGFDEELTYQQFAAVVLRALGVDTTGANYANVPTLAEEAGLVAAGTDFSADAKRGDTYVVIVTALNTEVAGTGKTLGEVLGLFEVTALAIAKIEQTNNREITVSFNKAVTAEEKAGLTYEVKSGLVTYSVTAKFADDNKSVVLSSNYLPAGEYDVTVKGFETKKVTVADEKPAKIEITANSLQKANNQDLGIKLFNQFGKEIANPILNVTVYNATQSKTIAADGDGNYDLALDADAKVDDNFVVTVTHSTGLSATKTFKIVAGSAATAIKLGTVVPLEGKNRISANDDGLVLPIELTDQYGSVIKLDKTDKTVLAATATNFTISGITFMLSEAGVVSDYAVDKDGKMTFDVAKASTLVINAVNPTTGATASTTVKIEGAAVVKTLQLNNPGVLVVAEEEVKIPYAAVDNFGGTVAAKDIVIDQTAPIAANAVTFNTNIPFAAGYPKINGKGELLFKFDTLTSDATAYIYAYVNGAQVAQLSLAVKKASTPVKINGIKDVQTYLAVNAEVEFDQDNITFIDNYNRTKNIAAGDYTVESSNDAIVDVVGGKLVGKAVGKADITVNFATGFTNDTKYVFSVEVVKADDIKSYAIKTIGTLYGKDSHTSASAHAKTVTLVGKLSNGTEVAIVQADAFNFVTTSDSTKVGVDGKVIFGLDEGTVTIAAFKGATKLAEQTVTVSKAAPIATSVAFNESEYTIANAATATFVVNGGTTYKITVKDQYGVAITTPGFLASSDTDVATTAGLVVTAVGQGQTTLTYITSNNVSATATIVVN